MSTQNPLDSQIIKLIVAMFNAAPGADVLAELRSALTAGESVENLARNLVQTAVFKSLYPDTLGSAEFAARFANNVLGEEVGFDQLAFATVELTALQLAGLDRGQVVLRAIEALLAVEPTNPEWGNARQAFENKVTVAEYYSIEKQKSAQTLEELQEVLAPVTSSEFSTENAIRVVDGLPPLPEPGTPTTPVTPTPEPTPVLSVTGLASASVNENSPYSAAPAAVNASGAVRWALSGEDAALFSIDEDTGALSMVARDFEAPADAGADSRYSITVSVTDAAGSTASQAITVTVADVLEPATLVLSGLESVSINENLAFAATPSVSGGIGMVTWSLEGADAEQFSINKATGALSMVARNFENAADADGNNVYEITVKAEDADSNSVTQAITVTVNDVQEVSELILGNLDSVTINENIEFTLAPALSGAIGAVTWTLTGPDAEKFSINTATGALSMVARNFESAEDADTNNVYEITITAEDADLNSVSRSINVTIADVLEPATLVLSGVGDAVVSENAPFTLTPGVTGGIGAVTWSLEGPDASRFSIDTSSGEVGMIERDFETPADADGNNVYEITLKAEDADSNSVSQAISVRVDDAIEESELTISGLEASYSQVENLEFKGPVPTVSGAIGAVTWSLEGGDADRFTVDKDTGEISMVARDFETPADSGADNLYNLVLRATDADGNTAIREVDVQVVNVNESSPIAITNISDVSVEENQPFTSAPPGVSDALGTVTWSLSGEDAAHFTINLETGIYEMVARDYERPVDADRDNFYRINVVASDTNGNSAEQAVSIRVTDVEDGPTLIIGGVSSASVPENESYTATATVANAVGAVQWSLGGPDAAWFAINESTGELSMEARDYESPQDEGGDNTYTVTIEVTDEDDNIASTEIVISIADAQEESALSISGLLDGLADENLEWTSATPDVSGAIGEVTWSLEGDDAEHFRIEASTGAVSLLARDFENPTDSDGDNVYEVTVRATDADENTATQALRVTVENSYEPASLVISGLADITLPENESYSVTPTLSGHQGPVTWRLEGADANRFTIEESTGVVSMAARDHEAPEDADTGNDYEVTVIAEDLDGNSASASFTVTVADELESATLSITGLDAIYSIDENDEFNSPVPAVTNAIGAVTWSLEGPDADKLSIDTATGKVSMIARNFEAPADADTDNAFEVTVKVVDADGNFATQAITVNVADEIETATLSITGLNTSYSIDENDEFESDAPTVTGAIGAVTWSIEGADADKLSIDTATGKVSMFARNFEAPADADTDNAYQVTVKVEDSDGNFATQEITVNVADEIETATLSITGLDATYSIDENDEFNSPAPNVTGAIGGVTWSLEGPDADKLSINAGTGVVSMIARDYETPADADTDNAFEVTVKVTDADGNFATQAITVSVADEIESATLSITGLNPTYSIDENDEFASTVPAVTNAIGAVTWSLEGVDADKLTINAGTGVVSMIARDFEAPADANTDNAFQVTVKVTDADGNFATQAVTINVANVVETTPLAITSPDTVSVNENAAFNTTLAANGGVGTITWSKTGGSDASLFSLTSDGVLTMSARDAEQAEDADANNTYVVNVQAADETGDIEALSLTVTVANVEDVTTAIPFTSPAFAVNEDATLSFTGADLFAQSNFADDFGVSLSSLTLSGRTGTLTVNGNTIAAGDTALVTSSSALTWRPASNVNGSSILMFNAQATASDGSTSSVVAVNANVAAVADASTLTFALFPAISGYDVNPAIARAQTVFFSSAFDNDGSMVLTLRITGNYSAADGDTLGISSSVSPVTAALFTNTWNAGTGTLTITSAEGQTPNTSGWNTYLNNIVFSTNDTDVGDSRTAQITLVSGPDAETKSLTVTLPFITSAGGAEAGMAFSVMSQEEDWIAANALEDGAVVSEAGPEVQSPDPLAWWQLAESYAMLR